MEKAAGKSRTTSGGDGRRRPGTTRAAKRERQRQIREIVTSQPITSQHELVDVLSERGFDVTQATASRDIAELGLVKVARGGAHVYVPVVQQPSDQRLRRVLSDYPVSIGRSGLILLLVSEAGTAGAIAQAIDDSTLLDLEGTVAGDNTVLVLFSDEAQLERWRHRFERLQAEATLDRAPER
jgi:transcriptional regulator of arginine metabolism